MGSILPGQLCLVSVSPDGDSLDSSLFQPGSAEDDIKVLLLVDHCQMGSGL